MPFLPTVPHAAYPTPLQRAVRIALYIGAWTVAVISAIGLASPWFADQYWTCEILCHFQVQYIVGMLAAAAVLAALRSRWCAGTLLAIGLIAFATRWLPFYFRDGVQVAGTKPLRILSANIRFDNPTRTKLLDLIDAEQPDVVLLFEVSRLWLPDLEWLAGKYPHSKVMPSPGHSGCGIFSRLPLTNLSIEISPPYPNFIVVADVILGGKSVRLFGTHPLAPYTRPEMELRNAQLRNLARRLATEPKPLVLAGDFNTSSWSPCFPQVQTLANLRDTRRGFGVLPTFPARFWPVRTTIDHCLVSTDLEIVDRRVGPHIGSDHLPILIDLSLP